MKQMLPQEKQQLDEIEAMIMKNFRLMLEWTNLEIKERLKTPEYIKGLIKRTDILIKAKNDFVKLFNEPDEKTS